VFQGVECRHLDLRFGSKERGCWVGRRGGGGEEEVVRRIVGVA
jgi:hypothetical protein